MTRTPVPDPRWYQAMMTLVYPGVLGGLLYALADGLADKTVQLNEMLTAGLALFALFVFDYLYSISESLKERYSWLEFIFDFSALIFLFLAGKAILGKPVFPSVHILCFLIGAKALAAAWEFFFVSPSDKRRPLALGTRNFQGDLAFTFIYVGVGLATLAGFTEWLWLTVCVLLADALVYLWHLPAVLESPSAPSVSTKAR